MNVTVEAARLEAERWGRNAGAWIWLLKTTRQSPERAELAEARAHDAAWQAAHNARVYLGEASA